MTLLDDDGTSPVAAQPDAGEEEFAVPGRHRAGVAFWRRGVRAVALGAAGVVLTAGLGWVTASAVGLTGTAAEPVVEALPTGAPQPEPSGPDFRQTLDLDGTHADRASRSSAVPTTAAATTTQPAPRAPSSDPAPKASDPPTRDAAPAVRPGDPCSTEGATAVLKSGGGAVCSSGRGNGDLKWRRA
jgi:hypothetical protein